MSEFKQAACVTLDLSGSRDPRYSSYSCIVHMYSNMIAAVFLKQQKYIVSEFWRPEVQDQSIQSIPFKGCQAQFKDPSSKS